MKSDEPRIYERVILGIEVVGFCILLALIWLDEYVDLPFRYLGALKTPSRPQEFWLEGTTVLLVAVVVVVATLSVFRRLRVLESFIQVCAWCRKVNVNDEWISIEQYLKLTHDVQATHGICPDCRANANRKRVVTPRVSA